MIPPMSDGFASELQRIGPDPAVLPHAMRYFVSARSGDQPPSRMREDLLAAGLAPARVEQAADLLQRDPAIMEAAALAILQAGWENEDDHELARGALGAAHTKLPVVEAALIAIVAVYGLWLTATKGRKSHQRVIRRGPDGSWEESETTEWYGPSGPLEAIVEVLGLPTDPDATDGANELPDGNQPSLPPGADAD
jgi:hypothetical protein